MARKRPPKKFDTRDKDRHLPGHREIQTSKEFRDFLEVVKLAPTAFDELPAPVQAYEQKERRLQQRDEREKTVVNIG